MKQTFVKTWRNSVQPRKQRKYRAAAPLHLKGTFLSAHLSKELRKKYSTRSLRIRKGDKVQIMRGQFKGKSNKVDRVDTKHCKIFVVGIELIKKDGGKTPYALSPSNLQLTELVMDDKKREKTIKPKEVKK